MSASAVAMPTLGGVDERAARVRVAIVDDHAVLRTAVRSVLSVEPDLEVVGEADDGAKVLPLLHQTPVDVLVLDLSMPGWTGLEVLHAIRARHLTIGVLVFTAHPARAYAEVLARQGVTGFLNKSCDPSELAHAVRAVAAGQRCFHDAEADEKAAVPQPHNGLTPRQLHLLTRFARGETAGTVSRSLGISIKSVTKSRYALLGRLCLRTNSQLTLYALRHQLMEGPSAGSEAPNEAGAIPLNTA